MPDQTAPCPRRPDLCPRERCECAPSFAREPRRIIQLRCYTWAMRGGPPEPPIYLRTARGTHYEVWHVRKCKPKSEMRYVFYGSRIATSDVPNGAKVVGWTWRR